MRIRICTLFIAQRMGWGSFALFGGLEDTYLGILCCLFSTLGCVTHTTTRRRASAYVSGEGRVVRTTYTSEGSV